MSSLSCRQSDGNVEIMNARVRAAAAVRLKEAGISRAELARISGRTRQEITRALNGGYGGGEVPPIWRDILAALELELTAMHEPQQEATEEPAADES